MDKRFTLSDGNYELANIPSAMSLSVDLKVKEASSIDHRVAPGAAVEGAITDGFGDVVGEDVGREVEVCNGARHFQDAIVSSGGEVEALHGEL